MATPDATTPAAPATPPAAPATPPAAPATPPAAPAVPVATSAPSKEFDTEKIGVQVTHGTVRAQVTGPPLPVKHEQPIFESQHSTDRWILDTSDPLAVQLGPDDPQPEVNPLTPEEALGKAG